MSDVIECGSCGNKSSAVRFLKDGAVQKAEHEKPCVICGHDSWVRRPVRVLHLTLKKEWFDKILSGHKLEEYREYKPYWIKRLVDQANYYRKFDEIHFKNGYSKDAPFMRVRAGCIFRAYRRLEGKERMVFVIELKEVLEVKNVSKERE